MADSNGALKGILLATLGLVAAFVVSALAGLWDDGSAGHGLPSPGRQADLAQVRVEVLNGAGTGGLAREATERLRAVGFDVVYFGNAARFDHPRSVVLDRVGRPAEARAVAAALGIDSVATAIDASLMLEATVLLGDDWPPAPVEKKGWLDRLRPGSGDTLP